ncbi:hypothetical protein F4677DRAFT_118643 [Hypoxylon crocopeplum]|nr:hypothetical protein F4677DRAFT_118643 [Hypoxylon crocopeplum]
MVVKSLEPDNRGSMACMVQWNKSFKHITQPYLYSTFSTENESKRPTLATFFRTVAQSITLASFVTSLKITKRCSALLPNGEGIRLIAEVSKRLGGKVVDVHSLQDSKQACVMLVMLPCLLPNIKLLHLGLGHVSSGVGEYHFLERWRDLSPENRLPLLDTVSLGHKVRVKPPNPGDIFTGVAQMFAVSCSAYGTVRKPYILEKWI